MIRRVSPASRSTDINDAILARFGIYPASFAAADDSPQLLAELWRHAEASYLNNPLPSLFKEKLFAYLSRFCSVPYCMARHAAFLLGRGHAAGDPTCPPMTADEVLGLLIQPDPTGEVLELHLEMISGTPTPLDEFPKSGTRLEASIFFSAVALFRQHEYHLRCAEELRRVLGPLAQHLVLLLSYIRSEHAWSEIHPELRFEPDVDQLFCECPALEKWCDAYHETVDAETEAPQNPGLTQLRVVNEILDTDSESSLGRLFELSHDMLCLLDTEGFARRVNSTFRQSLGHTEDELLSRQFVEAFVHPDDHEASFEKLEVLARGIPVNSFIVRCRHKDGRYRWVEWFGIPLKSQGLVFAIGREATERKVTHERLLQSERLAAIGEAIAGLAHESRNALQRGQAAVERLTRRVRDDPAALAIIAQMQKAQDDLHRLYEGVCSYAAPLHLDKTWCDLGKIVDEAWSDLNALREGRKTLLRQDTGGLELGCDVSRSHIRQVLRNIFENALAAKPDDIEVHVTYAPTETGGRPAIATTIRNNGARLTAEERERIFEAFYTTKTRGTGLGLAISLRIIEAHGGRIAVGEDEGGGSDDDAKGNDEYGTTIIVTIPRSVTDDLDDDKDEDEPEETE